MKHKGLFYILIFSLGSFIGTAQDTDYPYASEICRFKELDSISPPPVNAILFTGSSSFTLWQDVQDYFPGFTIINRGFGGSTLVDQIRYADDVILRYSPRQIVIYCGENDLAYSDTVTPEEVTARFITLFGMIRSELPGVKITYVSMKPSPSRWHMADRFTESNSRIREFISSKPDAGFVNVWDLMLDENHMPDTTLFLEDMLHMNAKGYQIWQKSIEHELIN